MSTTQLRAGPSRPLEPAGTELRALLGAGRLELPLPGGGATPRRWAALAAWGRDDLAVARLAEGHTDAVAILAEAGRTAAPGTLYGVWAARPGGSGAGLRRIGDSLLLDGTVRFCSGAHVVDRALVVADDPDGSGRLLVDVAVGSSGTRPAADTLDVRFDGLAVRRDEVVGRPDWYSTRPGFATGGGGVAAVWWGGAAGLLERAVTHLPATPDAHQLAHLGELDALLQAADALLTRTAEAIDAEPGGDHTLRVARVRTAVERVVRRSWTACRGCWVQARSAGTPSSLASSPTWVSMSVSTTESATTPHWARWYSTPGRRGERGVGDRAVDHGAR